jgi:hypothetical protein
MLLLKTNKIKLGMFLLFILFIFNNNVNFNCFYNNIIQYFMTRGRSLDIHYKIKWFYL